MPTNPALDKFLEPLRWDPDQPGERIDPDILMSRANSNRYLVTTAEGDVLINTGDPLQAPRHRERFEQLLGRPLRVRKIIFSQSHLDHHAGWREFAELDPETIAQAYFPRGQEDGRRLPRFRAPRRRKTVQRGRSDEAPHRTASRENPATPASTLFDHEYAFELGGRRFELYSTPGGETKDGLAVWLPDARTVFTGNLLGPYFGHLPALYTIRGDRLRSALEYVSSVELVIALGAERLITGHGDPIEGGDAIRAELTKLRDAVRYVHDETVGGMEEGKSLFTLMAEVRLPADLDAGKGRQKVSWMVRAIYEEYAGWFRFESATELYEVPPRAIWSDLLELAGGEALTARGRAHLAGGRPLQALHLTDVVLAGQPGDPAALDVRLAALEKLLVRAAGETWDEIAFLESEIEETRQELG